MMLCLHLFNREYKGLFQPVFFIFGKPLSYYISLFCDCCVPIFSFVSGYGLYYKYAQQKEGYKHYCWSSVKKMYVNLWWVILLFPVALGLLIGDEHFPGNWQTVLLNISGLFVSYSSIWWFFCVYIVFLITSSFFFQMADKYNPYFLFLLLFGCYVFGFYFRIYHHFAIENKYFSAIFSLFLNFNWTILQFMTGAFALKYAWNTKVHQFFSTIKYRNTSVLLGIIFLIMIHSIIPNFFISYFLAVVFIFLFLQVEIPLFIKRGLDFLAIHSTNLWLVHSFFYFSFFSTFIYMPQYPILIFLLLLACSLVSSIIINYFILTLKKWI